jgi:hypothetical protein
MVSYTDIDDFANHLEPWMREVFHRVRMLILTFPEVTEKFRYRNTPFYDCGGRMMLYLTTFQKKRFVLGFCNGHLMPDPAGMLRNEQKQTQIKHWEFKQDEPADDILLIGYIRQAIFLNLSIQTNASHHQNSKRK